MRKELRTTVTVALLATASVLPAHAVNKDMIQLQTQVQQLQDAVARLQQSNDERMGVLKDLVQQTADAINKMTVNVNGLKLQMQNQADATGAKSDQLSGQVQSLNDSLDELKARMIRMEKTLGDIQGLQQQSSASLSNLQPGGTSAPPASGNAPSPTSSPLPVGDSSATPIEGAGAAVPPPPAGPSPAEMYRNAYSDYMGGKQNLAASEFTDLIKAYPDDNLSGNAYFYLGEMALRADKTAVAIKNYDHVLERYPNNAKVPAAHLHKGQALISQKQQTAGIAELRSLIQRFPTSPEAAQAKSKIAALQGRR